MHPGKEVRLVPVICGGRPFGMTISNDQLKKSNFVSSFCNYSSTSVSIRASPDGFAYGVVGDGSSL